MRRFEKREPKPIDRALIDLRGQRDDLSFRIGILKRGDVIDPAVLGTLKRKLGILDWRIAEHTRPMDA
jgi:hypothetical protein